MPNGHGVRGWAIILGLGLVAGWAMAGDPSPAVIHELAPSGRLRVAINLGNPVLATLAPGALEPEGVSVSLARELGRRLKVPLELIPFDGAGKVTDALRLGVWDLAFLAIDPVRAQELSFTQPYLEIQGTYLVPAASALQAVEEVDRAGLRVAVARGSAYDLHLTRQLKQATRVVAPSPTEALEWFVRNHLEAAAGVRQPLEAYARAHPGFRVLPGQFMSIHQAMAVPKGREAGRQYLDAFLEELQASGWLAQVLATLRR